MANQDMGEDIQAFLSGKGKYLVIVFILGVAMVMLNPFVEVGAGQRGIILNFGAVEEVVLEEGLHFKIPIMQKIILMDVKIQKAQTTSSASTKDLQNTSFSIVVNHHIAPDKASWIYQKIGVSYKDRIIDPTVQEVVKAVTARYTAEQLITKRDQVSIEIADLLRDKLITYNIVIDNFSIVDFNFSQQFTQAIEEKQTAEQRALKASRDLDRIKIEALQQIEKAKAEAMSLKLQKSEVSDKVLKLREIEAKIKAIEKWNGVLPSVTSGAVPFLNLSGNLK